jgi:O-succinylhomoserine sulfhydrylase
VLAVDNAMCSPALQRRSSSARDLVIHRATKYIEGQGRVLAGAIAGRATSSPARSSVRPHRRPAISPFNAWICLKGMETLRVRMARTCANALDVARWLEKHPDVERVHYPGSNPIRSTRSRCASNRRAGAVLLFVVKGGREAAWRVIDAVKMISITANFAT